MAYCKAERFVWLTFSVIIPEQSTALRVHLGKTDLVKLSKSGTQDPAMCLNQNWLSHKAGAKGCHTGETDEPLELWWPQLSLHSIFSLCVILRDNSSRLEPRPFRTRALLHAGVVNISAMKNTLTIACKHAHR